MRYESTRGGIARLSFSEAILMGQGEDGGLLVPEVVPDVRSELEGWRTLPYPELAFEIIRRYAPEIPSGELRRIVSRSYRRFSDPRVVPLRWMGGIGILELFHGPTLAFKDIALQFLGNLFEELLATREGEDRVILAATSGDTGSAAIEALRGRRGMEIFVLYPHRGIAPLQERQMTTVTDPNVHCLAIEGSFDDCQRIVKTVFDDLPFKTRHRIGAVNSINWGRIVAQIVYYFHAWFQAGGEGPVRFSVPTGNFGDIYAGYLALRMGLPIERLILATNENDVLHRFFETGIYRRMPVRRTIAPAMDIQVASNLERYLYDRLGRDPARLGAFLTAFAQEGEARFPLEERPIDPRFTSVAVGEGAVRATITEWYRRHRYLLDPHSAIGVAAARRAGDTAPPTIALATAHPAKFPEVVGAAAGVAPPRHPRLDRLCGLPERKRVLPPDPERVKKVIEALRDAPPQGGKPV
ncbi:MAG: threonine synthase [Deltaproteobacteria bacterium]|nr:MAG: threonine synthase [Deltaproteobacteria bacterium]